MNILNATAFCRCGCFLNPLLVNGDSKRPDGYETGFYYDIIGEVFCPECDEQMFIMHESLPYSWILPQLKKVELPNLLTNQEFVV